MTNAHTKNYAPKRLLMNVQVSWKTKQDQMILLNFCWPTQKQMTKGLTKCTTFKNAHWNRALCVLLFVGVSIG